MGKPGGTLNDSDNYTFVQQQATREADAAARALFNAGATQVIVCDYHHSGINLDYMQLDIRCDILLGSGHRERLPTVDDSFGGVLFIGYHSRDNTAKAVMAHTYSSMTYQSYTINGVEVGEIDAAYAGSKVSPLSAPDDITVSQAKAASRADYQAQPVAQLRPVQAPQARAMTSTRASPPARGWMPCSRYVFRTAGGGHPLQAHGRRTKRAPV